MCVNKFIEYERLFLPERKIDRTCEYIFGWGLRYTFLKYIKNVRGQFPVVKLREI